VKYYYYKLISPRASFPGDITAEERALMIQHVAYWSQQMARGRVLALGPVADPKGTFGIGILKLEDGEDFAALVAADPVIQANVGFSTEIHPMARVMTPAQP
jgi:uncharacterized protein YciI